MGLFLAALFSTSGLGCSSVSASLAASPSCRCFCFASASTDFASPKSAILTLLRSPLSIRLPGLRSRWMRGGFFSWRYARPRMRSVLQAKTSESGSYTEPPLSCSCEKWSSKLPPSMSSITMRSALFLMQSPTNSTTLGCFRLFESTRSSAVRPSTSSAPESNPSRSFLIATALSGIEATSPRKTSPMQPSPIFSPTVTSSAFKWKWVIRCMV
mmetsp:Transcript_47016/g.111534  ORF Transcript_47016/g.111534 Transcript_47016/m.111534 type:complete len:213 (-) Transcript_47016:722-1360(-)